MKHEEDDMQTRFFRVIRIASNRWPRLKFIHAIPNGGKRNPKEAARLKAQGVTPGVADIFCPMIGYGGQHGLYIEFKAGKNNLSPEQREFRNHVEHEDYSYKCCYSTEEAVWEVEKYFCIKILENPRPKEEKAQ